MAVCVPYAVIENSELNLCRNISLATYGKVWMHIRSQESGFAFWKGERWTALKGAEIETSKSSKDGTCEGNAWLGALRGVIKALEPAATAVNDVWCITSFRDWLLRFPLHADNTICCADVCSETWEDVFVQFFLDKESRDMYAILAVRCCVNVIAVCSGDNGGCKDACLYRCVIF